MDTQVVYKWVRREGDRLVSAMRGVFELEYTVGRATGPHPDLPYVGPLAFAAKEDAEAWIGTLNLPYHNRPLMALYTARAVNPTRMNTLCAFVHQECIEKFWYGVDNREVSMIAPRGTLLTDSLTLLGLIYEIYL